MIRVGFVLGGTASGWLGGANYYRSLFSALDLLKSRSIQSVTFVSPHDIEEIQNTSTGIQCVPVRYLSPRTCSNAKWRIANKVFGGDNVLLRSLVVKNKIDVLSHYGPLTGTSARTIGWIPDFQHVHLPQFFSRREHHIRDVAFRRTLVGCDLVVVSSQTALDDLTRFAPEKRSKARVLRFVPQVNFGALKAPMDSLSSKYAIRSPFLYVPNQFWVHKNHRVLLRALALLRQQGVEATIVATGNTTDYRHPTHFSEIQAELISLGLAQTFRILGVVPYADLMLLMSHSIAVINPSLFEGWSTTVEEAKILGKKVLLSDIPVHREQNPPNATYFDPRDPEDVAAAISGAIDEHTGAKTISIQEQNELERTYTARRRQFAHEYQSIVSELYG